MVLTKSHPETKKQHDLMQLFRFQMILGNSAVVLLAAKFHKLITNHKAHLACTHKRKRGSSTASEADLSGRNINHSSRRGADAALSVNIWCCVLFQRTEIVSWTAPTSQITFQEHKCWSWSSLQVKQDRSCTHLHLATSPWKWEKYTKTTSKMKLARLVFFNKYEYEVYNTISYIMAMLS